MRNGIGYDTIYNRKNRDHIRGIGYDTERKTNACGAAGAYHGACAAADSFGKGGRRNRNRNLRAAQGLCRAREQRRGDAEREAHGGHRLQKQPRRYGLRERLDADRHMQ